MSDKMKTAFRIRERMNEKLSGCTMSKFLSVDACKAAREKIIMEALNDALGAMKEYEQMEILGNGDYEK